MALSNGEDAALKHRPLMIGKDWDGAQYSNGTRSSRYGPIRCRCVHSTTQYSPQYATRCGQLETTRSIRLNTPLVPHNEEAIAVVLYGWHSDQSMGVLHSALEVPQEAPAVKLVRQMR
ncbi:unnamed protein product [Arctogadus glacialis]